MIGLTNKKVIITGGASGIGLATAKRFIKEGASVAVIDRDEEAIKQLEKNVPELRIKVIADVSDHNDVKLAFKVLDDEFGTPDILINNAGVSIRHDFNELDPIDWQTVIGVNLNGVFYVAKEAAKRMTSQKSGVIINMGSTNGTTGYPFYADYNASKAGVIELTKSMALELAPHVRVNAVCPGYIMTPMQEAEYTPEMIAEVNNKIPLKRHGKPEEVAALFAFLCSDEAAFITGQAYIIDGGETAGGLCSR